MMKVASFLSTSRSLFSGFCLAFSLLFSPNFLSAKHIVGGEMTWIFLETTPDGLQNFLFTLTVYRDCASGGAGFDFQAPIGIFQGSTNSMMVESFYADMAFQEPVDPIIPPCADPFSGLNTCIEKAIYNFEYAFDPSVNETFYVVYQRCCRTEQIVNLTTPGDFGATYMAEMSAKTISLGNSSPIFDSFPPTFVCAGFPIAFDHKATDLDGDLLTYEFFNPYHGGGNTGTTTPCGTPTPDPPCGPPFTPVDFDAPYTFALPMQGNPTVAIDATTGWLDGEPETLGQFVVGVLVKEYRNGIEIGSFYRDFQFNVIDCTPIVFADVEEDSLLGPQDFYLKRCGQKSLTVFNQTQQSSQLISWEWEIDLGGGQFLASNEFHPTLEFPGYGIYTGTLYLNRNEICADTGLITIELLPGLTANYEFEFEVCENLPVQFTDLSTAESPLGIQHWAWNFGSGGAISTEQNPEFLYPQNGFYPALLTITDENGCTDEAARLIELQIRPAPEIPDLPPTLLCLPDTAFFDILRDANLWGGTATWHFGDGSPDEIGAEISHIYEKPGVFTVSVFVETGDGCLAADTFPFRITAAMLPHAGFDYSPKELSNFVNTVDFVAEPDSLIAKWEWTFGDFGGSFSPNPRVFFADTGVQEVKLVVTSAAGCQDTAIARLDVVPTIRFYVPNVFAPTDGGLNFPGNDQFGPLGEFIGHSDYELTIWSRWGGLVYRSTDPRIQWDGRTADGSKVVQQGVYVWKITMTGPRGEPFELVGTVTRI